MGTHAFFRGLLAGQGYPSCKLSTRVNSTFGERSGCVMLTTYHLEISAGSLFYGITISSKSASVTELRIRDLNSTGIPHNSTGMVTISE